MGLRRIVSLWAVVGIGCGTSGCEFNIVGAEPEVVIITFPPIRFNTPTQAVTSVASHAELKQALRDGKMNLALVAPIQFYTSDDAIDLDELVPLSAGNLLVMVGACDWYTGQLNRLGSFPEPLIQAGRDREWEFRFTCLRFDGWWFDGPALHLGYAQLSIFTDVRVQRFGGYTPPFSVGTDGWTSATEFYSMMFFQNEAPALIDNISDVRWHGGNTEVGDWKRGWQSGIIFRSGPHVPLQSVSEPLLVENVHMEGSYIDIEARGVTVQGGFVFVSRISINNSTILQVVCNGSYSGDIDNQKYGVFIDGRKKCPRR